MKLIARGILFYALICCLVACNDQKGKMGDRPEDDKEKIEEKFISIMTDLSKLVLLANNYKTAEDKIEQLVSDKWIIAAHKTLRERVKEGFCFNKDYQYVGTTKFETMSLKKAGIPDDKQKNCPLYLVSTAEKTIPTAGTELWKRTTLLRDAENTLKYGKEIDFTLSSPTNPATATSEINYTVNGTINGTKKFSGKSHQTAKISGSTTTLEITMNLRFDVGELGRPAEVEFESAATFLVENNQIKSLLQQKYSLDKQEIPNAKMENARGILYTIFAWDWPNAGPK